MGVACSCTSPWRIVLVILSAFLFGVVVGRWDGMRLLGLSLGTLGRAEALLDSTRAERIEIERDWRMHFPVQDTLPTRRDST